MISSNRKLMLHNGNRICIEIFFKLKIKVPKLYACVFRFKRDYWAYRSISFLCFSERSNLLSFINVLCNLILAYKSHEHSLSKTYGNETKSNPLTHTTHCTNNKRDKILCTPTHQKERKYKTIIKSIAIAKKIQRKEAFTKPQSFQ